MINPPNIPTDNLYKFMAIAGLSLMVVSTIWFEGERKEAFARSDNVRLQIKILDVEKQYLKTETDTSQELLLRATDLPSKELLKRIEDSNQSLQSRKKDLELKEAEVESQREVVNRIITKLELARFIYMVAIICGIALMAVGFWLWYWRSQIYQDRLLIRSFRRGEK